MLRCGWLASLGFCLVSMGCSGCEGARPKPSVSPVPSSSFPASFHRGVCLAHNYQHQGRKGYGSKQCDETLDELKRLGVGWVSLTPFGFAASTSSTQISIPTAARYPSAETSERVIQTIRSAHQRKLSVLLKPHVWISGGAFRGDWGKGFSDTEWEQWFSSYRAFIMHFAKLAHDEKVAVLSIGVELAQSLKHTEQWNALIRDIRSVYSGMLVYSANWDQVQNVTFWDSLDYVGVQFYPSVSKDAQSPVDPERLRRAFLTLSTQRKDKPVLLTEVGYRSVAGSGFKPYEWPERGQRAAESPGNGQADAYKTFFEVAREFDWIKGVYLWKWFTDPNSNEEGEDGFSPRNKEAQIIMSKAFRE